jgi:hypothetical protein
MSSGVKVEYQSLPALEGTKEVPDEVTVEQQSLPVPKGTKEVSGEVKVVEKEQSHPVTDQGVDGLEKWQAVKDGPVSGCLRPGGLATVQA